MEGSESFALLSTLGVPPSSRILPSSCCPDKDLVAVVSKAGKKCKMSLWKMQVSRKWEVEVDAGLEVDEDIVDLSWSPDCECVCRSSIHHKLYRPVS